MYCFRTLFCPFLLFSIRFNLVIKWGPSVLIHICLRQPSVCIQFHHHTTFNVKRTEIKLIVVTLKVFLDVEKTYAEELYWKIIDKKINLPTRKVYLRTFSII